MGRLRRSAMWVGISAALSLATTATAQGAGWGTAGRQANFVVKDFKFTTGETLPELRLHYTTLANRAKTHKGLCGTPS